MFGSDAGSDKDDTDVEAANSPGVINGKKDADCGVKKNDKDAAAPSFEESSTATRAQQRAGATAGGTSCSGMTVKKTAASPRVTQPPVPASPTAAAAASRAPTGNVDLGRDTAATAAAFLPRAPPPGTPTAFTGRRADSARMDNSNTKAPDSSPPASFRLSGARPVYGTAYSASLGRSTAAKETSSSARATAPLTVTARAGGTAEGRTLGRETVTEKTAVSPWPSAQLTETARIVRQVMGPAIQHDTAAEAPASSVPDSLPLETEQRTDGPSGGDRVDNGKAANEQASALDGRLALRASTPVVSTAWPARHAGALNHDGREDGEQAIIAAALEAASVAVRDSTSGAPLSTGPAAAAGATSTSVSRDATAATAGLPMLPLTHVGPGVPAPAPCEKALPSMSVVMAEIPGLGESDIRVAHRPSAPRALALPSSFGSFGDDESGDEGLLFSGAKFLNACFGGR